jgi:hypothetical protein
MKQTKEDKPEWCSYYKNRRRFYEEIFNRGVEIALDEISCNLCGSTISEGDCYAENRFGSCCDRCVPSSDY